VSRSSLPFSRGLAPERIFKAATGLTYIAPTERQASRSRYRMTSDRQRVVRGGRHQFLCPPFVQRSASHLSGLPSVLSISDSAYGAPHTDVVVQRNFRAICPLEPVQIDVACWSTRDLTRLTLEYATAQDMPYQKLTPTIAQMVFSGRQTRAMAR
jgi:hypothetical protein